MKKESKVLIVEDEVIVALDLEQRLMSLGYNVSGTIDNAEEVFEFLKNSEIKPDLILMDIHLKGELSGIDITNEINSKYKIPVVYVTANSNLETIAAAQKTNPFGFVFKPFNTTDIKVAIEIALNKYNYEIQLELLNSSLEKRVQQRTKELEKTNDHLKKEILLRNEVEIELVESRLLYQDTIKNLGSGLGLLKNNGAVLSANNSWVSIMGYVENDLKKMNISSIVGKREWKEIKDYLAIDDNEIWNKEYLVQTKSNEKYCNYYVSKVNRVNNSKYIVSVIDVDEARRNRMLLSKERELRMLSVFQGEENERKRISKELHDSLGQKLTAAKLTIGSVLINDNISPVDKEALSETKEIVEESMREVREVSQNLFPSTLSDFGLTSAISKIAKRINQSKKLKCEVKVTGDIDNVDQAIGLNLYRICQEGIANAMKHSGASKITISLFCENKVISLRILDNGKGMNIDEVTLGSGLNNIKERASAIGAEHFIKSNKNKGTEIIIRLENGK